MGQWYTERVFLPLASKVFCPYWFKLKRLCHSVTILAPKIRTSTNYFPKSLLNALNLFCYTNCLQCFSHFHVLTHSLKISFNPSLVAGFFLKAQRNENIRVRKYFKNHSSLMERNLLKLFLFAKTFLICHFLFTEEIRAMCLISKKQLVVT